jgi:uncharacterized membrane protein
MKTKFYFIFFFVLLISSQFITCTKNVVVTEPCFQKDILPLFVSRCGMNGCHSSNGKNHGYNLTNYEGIMKGVKSKHPLQSAVYNNCDGLNPSMPPNRADKLTREELSTIKYWINIGAPNTTNCGGIGCDTSASSFAKDIKPIISNNCVGCHNSNNQSGSIDLSNYTGVFNTIANNKLLGSVNHSGTFIAMPPSYQLDACSVSKIENWVLKGGLDN